MFKVNTEDKSIYVTRGDVGGFMVSAKAGESAYMFKEGDVVRFAVYAKKDAESVELQKDFVVTGETEQVQILLTSDDTKIGDYISKATDYWYEVVLNPETAPQTIIGYDEDGAKVFKLFPESKDMEV